MQTVSVQLSKAVFTAESVSRACHRHTGKYYVSIRSVGEDWQVELSSMDGTAEPSLAKSLENDALDELLRASIRAQTDGIAEVLLRTALEGAGLRE